MNNLIKNIEGEDKVSVGPIYFSPPEYIQDLLDQLRNDIFPLFQGSPLFTIARNTFCFIDHVSALKYGISRHRGEQTIRMRKILGEFARFDAYTNEKYQRYADFIIQVYRHDLVHNIRPFPHEIDVIEKDGAQTKKTSWFAIVQSLTQPLLGPTTFENFTRYFSNETNRKNMCHLRYYGDQIIINNFCLFFDLINYLIEYKRTLEADNSEKQIFIANYQSIVDKAPEIRNFTLDKTKDKECKIK